MKPKKILSLVATVLSVIALFVFARVDDDPIKKIVTQLNKWTDEDPQEKVYLHLDKPYYAAGDDIWFKAYITIGVNHQLSALSSVLNVELIDDRDSIKRAIKLPVQNGITWGDFNLPDSLAAGNYRIRAYTNYMRNAGDEYFFDKTIQIGNAVNNTVFTKAVYTYTTAPNNQQKVNASITYTDLNGIAYANKEVSYDVQFDGRSAARGKGITDANGVMNVSFTATAANQLKLGRIVTNIKYADKKVSTQTVAVKALSSKIDIQFFPEGGNMVAGVRGKIGFKATGADGLGVDVKGIIKDNDNQDVARMGATHFGMGYVVMMPQAGKTYKAVVTLPDGSESTVTLPVAAASGFLLSVNTADPSTVLVKVGTSQDIVDKGNAEINLVAQQNGKVYYAAKTHITSASFAASIPKSRFPTGLVQFTLFSSTGEPLNERLAFIRNPDELKLGISTEKQSYTTREKVKLNLAAKDATDKPVVGSFSVAVTDETKVPVDETAETTILSQLLLTSDLKGYIEKPNYYFTNPTEQTNADLDALLLTQGYRRFVWKQLLNDVFPPQTFAAEKSLTISGTIKTSGGKPVPKAKVMLLSTSGGFFVLDTVADDQGRFIYKNLIFKDSVRFIVQARTQKNSKYVEIELDRVAPPSTGKNKNAPDIQVNISNGLSDYLKNSKSQYLEQVKYGVGNHATALKEVVITEKKKAPDVSNNLNGAGNADQVLKGDIFNSCPTLSQCLNGRASFVIFRDGQAFSTRSMHTPMLIVLDGMQMSDDFSIDDISAADVESIEVLRTTAYTAIYGGRGAGGVLVISTKRGGSDTNYTRYAPGIVTYSPKGYYRSREFYAPKYDDPKTNAKMADLRTTIFWKPNMVTNKDGSASVEFFNADAKGTYRVVVEGIDNDGHIGRQVYRYNVE
ncbi:carboxypeptidase-like regulatory domain-containing protein [Mucilaginibacter boryungensis]|uniref:TonB-dependent receptor plug domain-containing protein n=1 Tax=Mucilaginibacter boryungensis TaxID=768480 RepID=A0ABR9XBR4_9SPHI|nr:TonB-dependent receptor plug domain-containing protein [Mucilaginibacter boryungensis]MBE9664787.1 TonB-dependent receptor plug domain-containing protein [Mucilaginibacter boryungensis]